MCSLIIKLLRTKPNLWWCEWCKFIGNLYSILSIIWSVGLCVIHRVSEVVSIFVFNLFLLLYSLVCLCRGKTISFITFHRKISVLFTSHKLRLLIANILNASKARIHGDYHNSWSQDSIQTEKFLDSSINHVWFDILKICSTDTHFRSHRCNNMLNKALTRPWHVMLLWVCLPNFRYGKNCVT